MKATGKGYETSMADSRTPPPSPEKPVLTAKADPLQEMSDKYFSLAKDPDKQAAFLDRVTDNSIRNTGYDGDREVMRGLLKETLQEIHEKKLAREHESQTYQQHASLGM